MFKASFYPIAGKFYTKTVHVSVTNSLSVCVGPYQPRDTVYIAIKGLFYNTSVVTLFHCQNSLSNPAWLLGYGMTFLKVLDNVF